MPASVTQVFEIPRSGSGSQVEVAVSGSWRTRLRQAVLLSKDSTRALQHAEGKAVFTRSSAAGGAAGNEDDERDDRHVPNGKGLGKGPLLGAAACFSARLGRDLSAEESGMTWRPYSFLQHTWRRTLGVRLHSELG